MNHIKIALSLLLLATLVSCGKKEILLAKAMVNGTPTTFDVNSYAIKNVHLNNDGSLMYQNYIISCTGGQGGPFFWANDSTGCCSHFYLEDFVLCCYSVNDDNCSVIDAELMITKESSDLLCGEFCLTALRGETDTIHVTDGEFMISLEVNKGPY